MRLTRFTTVTGSRYELKEGEGGSYVRRLSNTGGTNPTPRQGPDGQWSDCVHCSPPEVGIGCLITWYFDERGGRNVCTLTSAVAEVESHDDPG